MSRINEIVDILQSVARHPKKAVEDFTARTGKGAVGVLPVYAPEELIHASGFLPVGLWGGHKTISKARAFLPPFACSIMQSVMELELEGAYDMLKAVVFSVPCDTLKCMSQKWKGKAPALVFTHPQNRKIEAANVFLTEEFSILREKLEAILGVRISDEAISRSIDIYNENRQAMREFCEVAAEHPEIIDPVSRHAVIKSRFFMDKGEHAALVRELSAELKKVPVQPWPGKKVILTGIMAEPDGLLEVLRENGLAVAADDLAQESRQYRIDVPEVPGKSPLYRLARWWQDFDGCSLATDVRKLRGPMLLDMARTTGADGVIICMMKFCDPEEFDYPIYFPQLEKAHMPNLMIEVDQESRSFEQVKTRIQTFSELLG